MFQQAMQFWNNKITGEQQQQVEFLLGTILNLKDLPSLDILEKQHGFVQEWYEQDITWLKQTVNHLDKLPATIDLLILDGGEYTTYSEWQLLKSRVTTVVLDDTKTCKCRDIYQELHQHQDWLVVADHPNDRNGWAVFRHK
jgi:DNA phosphorothioation-dependent restriction protein DptG